MNHGVILGQRDSDYVGNTLPYEVLNPSGDWTPYLPPGEWQYINPGQFESMACVSFSALNVIETLYYFLTGTRRNFSDRFTARLSGTTPQGNWLWKVCDSIRKDGLVDEELWPTPPSPTWETYYATPPMEVVNKAKEFLTQWEVKYEFIDTTRESLLYHLKQSPIQVVVPGHAVMNFFTSEQIYKYFDSYSPYEKTRTEPFQSACKIVLRKISMYDLVENPNKLGELYARKGSIIRHISNYPTLIMGDKALDRQWNKSVILKPTAQEWTTYTETDEVHYDPIG